MPLMPKRTKYRKQQKGRNRGKATRGNVVTDGLYGGAAIFTCYAYRIDRAG